MTDTQAIAEGRVARVVGPVVDVEFPPDRIPPLYNALTVEVNLAGQGEGESSFTMTLEVAQHLGAFEAIFAEWSRRWLESLCPAQMVTWCLDMTAFDLVRLPAKEGAAAVACLAQTLADVYGEAWAELPRQQAVRRTAQQVADAAAAGTGLTLGKIDIVRFFLATRGLRACVQRVLR